MEAKSLESLLHRKNTRQWILGGLALFVLGLSIQYGIKASERGGRSAFLRWRPQLMDFKNGVNVYEEHLYPNPPIQAMILLPIAQSSDWFGLPPVVSALVWFYLKVGMTILMFHWVFQMVEDPERPFPAWAKALAVGLSLRPIMGDLSHGNVNLFIAFLVIGGLYFLHRGQQLLSGLWIALAIACKVTPALFIPYLVWKRAWKALIGVVIGLALFFWPGFLPALYVGWDHNLTLVQSWIDKMVTPFVIEGFVTPEHHNQSLPGLLHRLFTHSPSFSTYVGQVYTPLQYHNFTAWDPNVTRWIVKGVMGLFVLLIAWTCRPTLQKGEQSNAQQAAEYSLVLIGMLLFSERTWKHHCVILLLPFAVFSYFLVLRWNERGWRFFIGGSLLLVMALITTTSTSFLGKEYGKLAQVYGAYTWSFFVMLATLAVLLRWPDPVPSSESASSPKQTEPELRRAG